MIAPDLQPLARPIDQFHLLEGNPRKGDVQAVARSYDRFGQRKPIVARRDGTVIAGNHQLLAARSLGWTEIAVVYVDDDDITASAYALADNRTSDLGTYDDVALADLIREVSLDADLLKDSGYDQAFLNDLLDSVGGAGDYDGPEENPYTTAVMTPQYEIVGEEPLISELYDDTKLRALHADIDAAELPEDIRYFLKVAAYRHVVINFRKVAEFYPHVSAEIQQLMEDQALVIIDFDDAMRQGYIRLKSLLAELRDEDGKQADDD